MNTSSFEIGETFEDYIQRTIFPKQYYDLIHRTSGYKQNIERYPEESLKPDFKFRCRASKQEFHIEAKFRSKFGADGKIHIIDLAQFNRFKVVNDSDCPVFIVVGYEGRPSDPKSISLLSLDQITYLDLFKSALKKHEINKGLYNRDELNLKIKEVLSKKEGKPSELARHNTSPKHTQKVNSKKVLILLPVSLLVLISLLLIFKTNTFHKQIKTETPTNAQIIINNPINKSTNTPTQTDQIAKKTDSNSELADLQSPVDELNAALSGDWTGDFGPNTLQIHVDEIDSDLAIRGYNVVNKNRRDLKGKIEYNGNSNYLMTLAEPGDDEWDGLFKINYSDSKQILKGIWIANNGKQKREFVLTK